MEKVLTMAFSTNMRVSQIFLADFELSKSKIHSPRFHGHITEGKFGP